MEWGLSCRLYIGLGGNVGYLLRSVEFDVGRQGKIGLDVTYCAFCSFWFIYFLII